MMGQNVKNIDPTRPEADSEELKDAARQCI